MKVFDNRREAQYVANNLGTLSLRYRVTTVHDGEGWVLASTRGYVSEKEAAPHSERWVAKDDGPPPPKKRAVPSGGPTR